METKKFQRNKEDFICEKCGREVEGNGYTNHCPACLWSKHVDVNPGDRAEECQGMMEPVALELKEELFRIIHKCEKCGHEKKNKAVDGDDFNKLVKLSRRDK